MRSLRVVVVNEPPQPAADAVRTAVPGRIEAVRSLFERLEPPLDVVPAAVLHLTAQSQSGQSGPVAEAVDTAPPPKGRDAPRDVIRTPSSERFAF